METVFSLTVFHQQSNDRIHYAPEWLSWVGLGIQTLPEGSVCSLAPK